MTNSKYFSMITRNSLKPYQLRAIKGDLPHVVRAGEITGLGFAGFVQSMSRRGNCWDNACAESFFKSMKTEWLYDLSFKTRQEAKDLLFEYIEVFYNRKRAHSSIGYESPESYESKPAA